MASSRVSASEAPLCQEYSILRSLSSGGAIVGLTPQAASEALLELGLSEIEKPARDHDGLLLGESREHDHRGAFLCLRCRVSWPLEQRVRALHRAFARQYGVEAFELAAFALDDRGQLLPYRQEPTAVRARQAEPFTVEVIRSFNPGLSSLSHWAREKLDGRNDLKAYLKQQGVLLIGDWALLGDASYKEVREAVGRLNGSLSPAAAEQLHRNYLSGYRRAKILHRQRTGRQRGWEPDEAFLLEVAPTSPAKQTKLELEAIATAVRCSRTGQWQKAEAELLDGERGVLERWADDPPNGDDLGEVGQAENHQDQVITKLVEEIGRSYAQQLVGALTGNGPERQIWQAWADGLNQRQIANRCGTNQARVSRTLRQEHHAGQIATLVMETLKRRLGSNCDAQLAAVFQSLERFHAAEARVMNQLLKPEQEGGIPPMRRWVKHALEPCCDAPALGRGCGDGELS